MDRTIKSALLLLTLIVIITSCQKELSEDDGLLPANNNNNSFDCKSCNYYPFCDGSTYTYVDTTAAGPLTTVQTLEIVGDTTVDGKVFQKASTSNTPGSPISYHNCTAGQTTLFGFSQPDNRVTTTILKADEPVGTTWTDINTNAGQPFNYTWTIMAKDIDKTVLTVSYSNVIQVHLTLNANILGTPSTLAESDYYYAPGVGLIDNITYDMSSGSPMLSLHRVLQNYHIP